MSAQVEEIVPQANCQAPPEQYKPDVEAALQLFDEESIERHVAIEIHRLTSFYEAEEAAFVQKMLEINPIVEHRRPSQPGADPKRAEACRRSRYNGKVKKATLRYRHQFITQKLRDSVPTLKRMRDVAANLERRLLNDPTKNIDGNDLERLKRQFGLDKFQFDFSTLVTL